MPRASRFRTYDYTYEDGSVWTFRAEMDDGDEDKIQTLHTKTIIPKVTPKQLRAARKQGKDAEELIAEQMEQVQLMHPRTAKLLHMSVRWSGPEFTVPDDELDADGNPHPQRGQLCELSAAWIERGRPEDNAEVARVMDEVWAGRDPEAQAEFPGSGQRLDIDGGDLEHAPEEMAVPEPAV